jgi:hypothetical protein
MDQSKEENYNKVDKFWRRKGILWNLTEIEASFSKRYLK